MDAETRAELEMLRERAYGRSSDIEQDPTARRRLIELEARAAASQRPASAAPADPDPAVRAPGPEESVALGSEAPAPDESPEPPASALPRWVKIAAPLAAVALVVVTALVTTLIVSAGSPYAGIQRVDHLHLLDTDELADLPPVPFRGYDRRFRDFMGYAVTAAGGERGEYQCLTVSVGDEEDPSAADMNSACGAVPFPLTVTIVLSGRSSAEALETYPDGTALHFALNGSGVDVYVAEP